MALRAGAAIREFCSHHSLPPPSVSRGPSCPSRVSVVHPEMCVSISRAPSVHVGLKCPSVAPGGRSFSPRPCFVACRHQQKLRAGWGSRTRSKLSLRCARRCAFVRVYARIRSCLPSLLVIDLRCNCRCEDWYLSWAVPGADGSWGGLHTPDPHLKHDPSVSIPQYHSI